MCGTSAARYESPPAIPEEELHWSCPLLQSLGVNHMKFAGFAEFREFRNSVSEDDVVLRRFAHLAGVFMSAKVRNAKWSAVLGGRKLQVTEMPASSAQACHVLPDASMLSIIFGDDSPQQQ